VTGNATQSDVSLPPGSTIGILGGGQLGRMLTISATELGMNVVVFSDAQDNPTSAIASRSVIGQYDDTALLEEFADAVDVITYEFENIPTSTVERLSRRKPVAPGVLALQTAQDRLTEKNFVTGLGIACAPYCNIETQSDVESAQSSATFPAILKTRRMGYDGKGQIRINSASDLEGAWRNLSHQPCVLEACIGFEREVSVVAARGRDGTIVAFDTTWTIHGDHILREARVPSNLDSRAEELAKSIAERITSALDYVGVLAVELFVVNPDDYGQPLLVNEIAPRVHNSGHWTQDACGVSQFEQHIRAVCGWPLGATERHSNAVMKNLIGDEIHTVAELAKEPRACIHHYGKGDARPGRKMGHVTYLSPLTANFAE